MVAREGVSGKGGGVPETEIVVDKEGNERATGVEFRTDDDIREDFQRLDREIKQARETNKPLSEQTDLKIQREKVRKEGQERRVLKLESEAKTKREPIESEIQEAKQRKEGLEKRLEQLPNQIEEAEEKEKREVAEKLKQDIPRTESKIQKIESEIQRLEEVKATKLVETTSTRKARLLKKKIKRTEAEIERLERGKQAQQRNEEIKSALEKKKKAKEEFKEEQRLERLTRPDKVKETKVEEPVVEESEADENTFFGVEETPVAEPPVQEPIVEEPVVEETPKKARSEEIQEELDLVKKETQEKEDLLEAVEGLTTREALANSQSDRYTQPTNRIPGTKRFQQFKNLKLNNRAASKKFLVDLAKRHKIPYSNNKGTLSNEKIADNIAAHIKEKYGIKLKSVGLQPKKQQRNTLLGSIGGKTGKYTFQLEDFRATFGQAFVDNLRAGTNNKIGLFTKEGTKTNKTILDVDGLGEMLLDGEFIALDDKGQIDFQMIEEVLERLASGDPVFGMQEDFSQEMAEDEDSILDRHISDLHNQLEEAQAEEQTEKDEKDSLSQEEYEELEIKAELGELSESESEQFRKATDARIRLSGGEELMFFMGSGAVVNAVKKMMKGYSIHANRLYNFLDVKASRLSPLGNLPDQDRFLNLRDKLGGKLQAVDKIAKDIYKAVNSAPEQDKPAILEFLTNKGATSTMIVDPEARRVAVRIKKTFQSAGKSLVKRGLLSPEAFENYSGAYLPRLYMAHMIKGDLFKDGSIKLPNGKKASNFGFLKPRKDIPEEVRDTILGEIKNAGFLAAKGLHTELRDIAILDSLDKIARNPEWVLPESVVMWPVNKDGQVAKNATPWSAWFLKQKANELRIEANRLATSDPKLAERLTEKAERMEQAIEQSAPEVAQINLEGLPAKVVDRIGKKATAAEIKKEANRLREQARQETFESARADRMIELADRLDGMVDPILKPRNADDYIKVPENNERYGALQGVHLHKEIYEDFIDTMTTADDIWKSAEKIQQLWKLSKVALNPPTQFRNFASNMILLNLSGMSIPKLTKGLASAVRQTEQYKKASRVAQRGGIGKSTFSSQEMSLLQEDFLRIEREDIGELGKLWKMMESMTKKGLRGASDLYGAIEAIGKTIKIMDEMDKGKTATQAVREANKWLFDYSLVPKTVRQVRKYPIGVPFLTFYYKAFPRMVETAIKTPWRFAPYAALKMAMSALFQAEHDMDDEDYDKLTKIALPEWLKDKPGVVPLPYKDANGKWQFLDISYLYPWSQYHQFYHIGKEAIKEGKFDLETAKKLHNTMGIFGGALPTLMVGLKTNVDPFTNKKIARDGALPSEKAKQTIAWLYNIMAPPWLNYGAKGSPEQFKGVLQKMLEAWQGKNVSPYTGEPKQTMKQATARIFGLNVYPIDYQQSVRFNVNRIKNEIKAAKQNAQMNLRNPNLSKEQRERNEKIYIDYIKELGQQGTDFVRDAKLSKKAEQKLFTKGKR